MPHVPLTLLLLPACLGLAVQAETAAELLSKGIFLQDTQGDLEGAIKIFQRVLMKGKETRDDAAQAQYRLGLAYRALGRQAEARQAFLKVVDQYPTYLDLVSLSRAALSPEVKLRPAPWRDGERLEYELIREGAPMAEHWRPGVSQALEVRTAKDNPNCWLVRNLQYGGVVPISWVELEKATLRPTVSEGWYGPNGKTRITYTPDLAHFLDEKGARSIPLQGTVFDLWGRAAILRCLPLAPGFEMDFSWVSPTSKAPGAMHIKVSGEEDVVTRAGKFSCYRVECVGGPYWIAKAPPYYLVKYGTRYVSSLLKVSYPEDPGIYRDDALGVSLDLPGGWRTAPRTQLKASPQNVYLVDPETGAMVEMNLEAIPDKEPGATYTPEELLTEWQSRLEAPTSVSTQPAVNHDGPLRKERFPTADLGPWHPRIQAESWRAFRIGAAPAVSRLATCLPDPVFPGFERVEYAVWVRGPRASVMFRAWVPKGEMEALRPRVDAILASLVLK